MHEWIVRIEWRCRKALLYAAPPGSFNSAVKTSIIFPVSSHTISLKLVAYALRTIVYEWIWWSILIQWHLCLYCTFHVYTLFWLVLHRQQPQLPVDCMLCIWATLGISKIPFCCVLQEEKRQRESLCGWWDKQEGTCRYSTPWLWWFLLMWMYICITCFHYSAKQAYRELCKKHKSFRERSENAAVAVEIRYVSFVLPRPLIIWY